MAAKHQQIKDKHQQISHGRWRPANRWKGTTPTTSKASPEDPWLDGPNRNPLVLQEEEHMVAAGEDGDGRGGVPPLPDNKVSLFGFPYTHSWFGGTTEQI